MATCRGIDVSVYQNAQDWAARKREGVVFAFAKASEGQRTHDAHFATHITGIKNAGLVPGAYHFAWPNQDVALEAANYIAAVRPYAGRGFVHWLDLERRSDGANYKGTTAAGILAWVTKWLARVRTAFPGQRVGVYTSGSDLAAGHVPAGTTIWYPAYTWGYTAVGYEKAEAAAKPHPSGWTPLLWQFTSTPIDRSICYLSEAALRTWAGGEEDPLAGMTKQDIFDAVWKLDQIGGPADAPDHDTNPTWQAQSILKDLQARTRALQASVTALSVTNAKLVDAVAKLAAEQADLDPAAIVAELKAAIESVTIHLDVPNA